MPSFGVTARKQAELKKERNVSLPLVASLTTISSRNYLDLVNIYESFKHLTDIQVFYLSWWIDEERAREHDNEFMRRFNQRATLPFGWVGDWRKFDYDALSKELKELKRRSCGPGSTPIYIMPNLFEPEDLHQYYTNHKNTFGFDECTFIYQSGQIDSNGDLSPCRDYHDFVVGNVKEHTVTELWNSQRFVDFRKSVTGEGLMPVCARCCGLMGY